MFRRIGHGIVWMGIMPIVTYWFVAKSFWVHTQTEKLVLIGLFGFGALMFVAVLRRRHAEPPRRREQAMERSTDGRGTDDLSYEDNRGYR